MKGKEIEYVTLPAAGRPPRGGGRGSGTAATTSGELRASKNEQAEPLRKSFELPARTSADPDPEEPRAARFV